MNLKEMLEMKALFSNSAPKKSVTKSYRKGRRYRVQQIFDRNGFVVKQIIHRCKIIYI